MVWGRRGRPGKRSEPGISERNTHPTYTERPLACTGETTGIVREVSGTPGSEDTQAGPPATQDSGCPCPHTQAAARACRGLMASSDSTGFRLPNTLGTTARPSGCLRAVSNCMPPGTRLCRASALPSGPPSGHWLPLGGGPRAFTAPSKSSFTLRPVQVENISPKQFGMCTS